MKGWEDGFSTTHIGRAVFLISAELEGQPGAFLIPRIDRACFLLLTLEGEGRRSFIVRIEGPLFYRGASKTERVPGVFIIGDRLARPLLPSPPTHHIPSARILRASCETTVFVFLAAAAGAGCVAADPKPAPWHQGE